MTVLAVLIIFVIQQSLLISFGQINLLLLYIIWLAFWQKPNAKFAAIFAGLIIDWQCGVIGPGLISLVIVNLIILQLARHLSLENFNHYFFVSFVGVITFFIIYYLLLLLTVNWLYRGVIENYFSLSWLLLIKLIATYQLLLILGYFFRKKKYY